MKVISGRQRDKKREIEKDRDGDRYRDRDRDRKTQSETELTETPRTCTPRQLSPQAGFALSEVKAGPPLTTGRSPPSGNDISLWPCMRKPAIGVTSGGMTFQRNWSNGITFTQKINTNAENSRTASSHCDTAYLTLYISQTEPVRLEQQLEQLNVSLWAEVHNYYVRLKHVYYLIQSLRWWSDCLVRTRRLYNQLS